MFVFTEILSTFRQHSTTEYLPGMVHSESIPGLLPKFPSALTHKCCMLREEATYFNLRVIGFI
jgi:hypothetical protein